jgi:hypothetical protein
MTESIAKGKRSILDRYQKYRTRRFLKHEQTWFRALPRWRSQFRRRMLVVGLCLTFAFMFGVSVLCAFGIAWDWLFWLSACVLFIPLLSCLQIVTGGQADAPSAALDESALQQRNNARSIGLTVTQGLMLIPILYLCVVRPVITGITGGSDTDLADVGGWMVYILLLISLCSPAMVLGWTRPDPDPEVSAPAPAADHDGAATLHRRLDRSAADSLRPRATASTIARGEPPSVNRPGH